MALRNHPRISAKMRQKVVEEAAKIGYRPDPQFAKLMTYMRVRRIPGFKSTLCALTNRPEAATDPEYVSKIVQSAHRRADELGYGFEVIRFDDSPAKRRTLQRMLLSRGVDGLLLLPMRDQLTCDNLLSWEKFSIVATSYSIYSPQFHRVVPHQYNNVLTLCTELRRLGYIRIGLVLARRFSFTLNHTFVAAVAAHNTLAEIHPVKPFLYNDDPWHDGLKEWFERESPDALIVSSDSFAHMVAKELGLSIPGPVAFAVTNKPLDSHLPGIDERPEDIGRSAVELLALKVQTGERGIPRVPTALMISGQWVGNSAQALGARCSPPSVA